MSEKTFRYKLHGCSVETVPYCITGGTTLRVLVSTKAGNYRTILLTVGVHEARRLRDVLGAALLKFKSLASELYRKL